MGSPVMQFQILSKAPAETVTFYSSLFGWNVNAANPIGYREISTGSAEGIRGGIWPAPPRAPNFVQLFVAVTEVTASVKRAEEMGAKIIVKPTNLPNGSELAILHDPQGLAFGIMKAS